MRVLQLVQRPQRRGAEVFAYDLTRRFEELGIHAKTVYLYGCDGAKTLPQHESDVYLNAAEDHIHERLLQFNPFLLKRIVAEIGEFKPDIVQVNGSRTVKYGALSKRFSASSRPWKLIYRNIGIPSDWHRWWGTVFVYRKAIMPQMDGIVAVSRCSLENATSLYRMRVPSTIILNGISTKRLQTVTSRDEFRKEMGVDKEEIVLLFLGFLDEVKRPNRFLRVLSHVYQELPGVRGWIVGDGPLRMKTEALAESLGLGEKIRYFGSQDDVASFMQAADVFVMTSHTEGVPAVAIEAGFMGLPVVSTNVGGIPECVRNGETGLLVDPESEGDMNEAILKLASRPELRSRMGENARQWVRNNLTIEYVADRYLDFYCRILGRNLPSRTGV